VSRWTPCKRRDFVRRLRSLGFEGPCQGSRHQQMTYKTYRLPIPSNKEYSVRQLREMVSEVEQILGRNISLKEWEAL